MIHFLLLCRLRSAGSADRGKCNYAVQTDLESQLVRLTFEGRILYWIIDKEMYDLLPAFTLTSEEASLRTIPFSDNVNSNGGGFHYPPFILHVAGLGKGYSSINNQTCVYAV